MVDSGLAALGGALIGGGIGFVGGVFQRRHDRQVRLNDARIEAYSSLLSNCRMMIDDLLYFNSYNLSNEALVREIENRYLAFNNGVVRANMLSSPRVRAALNEYTTAIWNKAEALRKGSLDTINELSDLVASKHTALFAAVWEELGIPKSKVVWQFQRPKGTPNA